MFAKFRGRYGHKWTSRYPNEAEYILALREWGEVLSRVSGEQIRDGLASWDGDHPPDAYEFRKACRESITRAEHKPYRALPPPKGDPAIAGAGLDKLKKILGVDGGNRK